MLLLCYERLKNERKKLKLTQQKFALLLDVSDMTIKRWETGVTAIPSDKLVLMKNLGLDVSYILFGESDQQQLEHDEALILEKYREADEATKNKMLMLLLGKNNTSSSVVNQATHTGSGDQINAKKQKIDKRNQNQTNNFHAPQQNSSISVENQHGGSIVGIKNE